MFNKYCVIISIFMKTKNYRILLKITNAGVIGQCGLLLANIINISCAKAIYDYINSYSSNILCSIAIFSTIKSLLMCILMFFCIICKHFPTNCMQNQHFHPNELYFIQYYTINNL